MATAVFEMFGKLSLDKSEYDKGLGEAEQSGSSFASKLGQVFSTAGKVAAAGLTATTAAVVALTKSAVDGYANYEQLKGGVETLFKGSADTIMKYASEAYKTAGLSANQYMETTTSFAASLIQSTGGNVEQAADLANQAVIDMSDNANKMGTDMSAIQTAYMGFSKQNYTMLDNLKLGYGGTKSEMERLILDAEKLDSNFKATRDTNGDLAMSFGDIVQAIHIVQTDIGITGTTALEASTTISGSINTMKSAWSNLVVGLGDDTQEMDVLIDNFVESVVTVIGNLIPRIQTILGGIGELVSKMVGVLAEQIPALLQTLLPPLLEAATQLFTALAAAIPELLDIILQQLPMIVDSVVGVIPTIVEGLMALLPTLLEVGIQIIVSIIQGIAEALPTLIPAAVETITTLVETLINNLPLLIDAGLKLLMGLVQGIINAIPKLVAALPKIITAILNFFTQALPQIIQAGFKLLTALIQNLPQIISTIVAALPQIITAVVNFFVQNISTIVQAGIQLFTALIGALPQIINAIVDAIPQIIDAICQALTESLPIIIEAGVQLFVALIQNLPQIIAKIITAVPQIIWAIVKAFANFTEAIWNVGKSIVTGIWQGIKNATTWLFDMLKGWVSDAVGWIAGLLGIHSPSTIMRDRIGKMIGLGVAEGIEDSIGDVEEASNDLLGAIPNVGDRDFSMNIRRNMSDSYTSGMELVMDRINQIMQQFQQTIILEMDEREFGRAVRGYV